MSAWEKYEIKEAPKGDTTVPREGGPYTDFINLVPIHLCFPGVDPAFLS